MTTTPRSSPDADDDTGDDELEAEDGDGGTTGE